MTAAGNAACGATKAGVTSGDDAAAIDGTAAALLIYQRMVRLGIPMYARAPFGDEVVARMRHRCPVVVKDIEMMATSAASSSGPVNCDDPSLSQSEWMKNCSK